jgi:hypothetical protein
MITTHEKPLHWAEAFGLSALVHVGIAYFVLTTVVDLRDVFDTPEQTAPSLQITSLSVESSTLTSTDVGTGADTISMPQTLAPVSDVLTPVAPAPPITEPAGTIAAPDAPTPQRLTPVAPATPAIAPEAVSPLRPQTQTLAPVGTAEPTSPTSAAPSLEPAADVVDPIAPEVPEAPEDTAPPPSEAPLPSSAAEPDPLAADLINRIRAAVGEACLIAVPQQTADGEVALQIFAANEASVAPYADEILAGLNPRPAQDTFLVDPRQCAALDFIRQSVAYPTSPMTLGVDTARIASNEELTGRIAGTGGRNVTLVLVDDNGVTQDLGGYLNVAVNTARFAVPLRRSGNVRDTRQLLIALGTGSRPQTVTAQNGQLAADYFDSLTAEINGNAAVALVPFEVR